MALALVGLTQRAATWRGDNGDQYKHLDGLIDDMLLNIATQNIHKGVSQFGRRLVVHELRAQLVALESDIVFLQEVQGAHQRNAARWAQWPSTPQYEFLADSVWRDFAYGRNAVYDHGDHGNAILSRYPILRSDNIDVSSHAFERRGLLNCEIDLMDGRRRLHCWCVHLALDERGRHQQLGILIERIRASVPLEAPLIVAGDFNDWRNRSTQRLRKELGMTEVFHSHRGRLARSFPAQFPVLRLDRIYVRGMTVQHTNIYHRAPWSKLSDHAALTACVEIA